MEIRWPPGAQLHVFRQAQVDSVAQRGVLQPGHIGVIVADLDRLVHVTSCRFQKTASKSPPFRAGVFVLCAVRRSAGQWDHIESHSVLLTPAAQ